MKPFKPDIICLPETFTFVGDGGNKTFGNTAEERPYPSLEPFRTYARQNKCYIICPINTHESGKSFNAAVILDRAGRTVGDYKKAHTTEGEMGQGISAGPLDPPIFDLDFGRIGIQICFDIQWDDGWRALKEKEVDIVFWPSAFSGGKLIQSKAWQTNAYAISSTIKGPARICDMTGETIAQTEFWNRNWICAPINLEKRMVHTWPYVRHFAAIKEKYGRDLLIRNYAEEEWSVLESLSPDVSIREVMSEFNIPTFHAHLASADKIQVEKRPG